jgi:hypothetical protein
MKSKLAWVGLAFLFFSGSFLFYRAVTIEGPKPNPPVAVQPAQLTATPAPALPVAPPARSPSPPPAADEPEDSRAADDSETDPEEVTVYVTRTGQKYHREGCRYLSRSMIPMSLQEAQDEGYEPCSVCHPPE